MNQNSREFDLVVILVGVNDLVIAAARGEDYELPPPVTESMPP